MRLGRVVVLCFSLSVIYASAIPQDVASNVETVRSKAHKSYKKVMEQGKTCLGKVCELFGRGRDILCTRIKNALSSIRRKGEKDGKTAGSGEGEGSEEEAFDLSPEDIEKLIEEIKKKLSGYMDVTGEQQEGEGEKEEEKEEL
ncbi:uncharacterized protein Eint_010310 [Encephalitozoon intestinalis ATCC 50506]|uniref:Uncharacterized protein n=1 Tax=Encephalitozoon intestinalis (strain ATCC 50506) TaxID=876142 RepID=E0S5A9_ENCIT|nr:uncharacterized protein Eint_010310 [Encephalitozoon intestinalis ATCC 50506]ADM10894.1 hypothetical protein Eint_010310 [Encephalitozoon intestinalis ATCC 50506]UTX44526.1 hypothetical protein GPK93_01g00350 [Encephalitozoon intestinalis]